MLKKKWTRLACYPSNLRHIPLVAVNAFLIRTDVFIFCLFFYLKKLEQNFTIITRQWIMNNHQGYSIKQLGTVANILCWNNQGHFEYQFILPYKMKIKYNYPPVFSVFIILMHLKYFFRDSILFAASMPFCVFSWKVCVNRLSVL